MAKRGIDQTGRALDRRHVRALARAAATWFRAISIAAPATIYPCFAARPQAKINNFVSTARLTPLNCRAAIATLRADASHLAQTDIQ